MRALEGLEGVTLVEDDWARGMDADLLHVTYDGSRVTIELLLVKIQDEGFEAKVQKNE